LEGSARRGVDVLQFLIEALDLVLARLEALLQFALRLLDLGGSEQSFLDLHDPNFGLGGCEGGACEQESADRHGAGKRLCNHPITPLTVAGAGKFPGFRNVSSRS